MFHYDDLPYYLMGSQRWQRRFYIMRTTSFCLVMCCCLKQAWRIPRQSIFQDGQCLCPNLKYVRYDRTKFLFCLISKFMRCKGSLRNVWKRKHHHFSSSPALYSADLLSQRLVHMNPHNTGDWGREEYMQTKKYSAGSCFHICEYTGSMWCSVSVLR